MNTNPSGKGSGNPSGNPSINPSRNPSTNSYPNPWDNPSNWQQEPFTDPFGKPIREPMPHTKHLTPSNHQPSTWQPSTQNRHLSDNEREEQKLSIEIHTERSMLDLLLARYSTERQGTIADRWVRAEHVRSSQGVWEPLSIADFIAIDKYASSQAIHGHEVKVSRSDWLTELRDPSKAERIKRFCHRWWLVVPDASIVKPGELPEGWGLMVKAGNVLRAKTRAPKLEPEPLTLDFVAGLTAAVQRTAMREPLHRDARTIATWNERLGSRQLCQGCGEPAPCQLHQPRAIKEQAA